MQSALQDHAAGLCDVQPGDGRPDRAVATRSALFRRPGLRDGICAPPRLDQEDGRAFRGQLSHGEEPAERDRCAARQEHAGSVSTRVRAGAAFTRGHHGGGSAGETGLTPGGTTMSVETRKVLEMLAAGKITSEDAERLLDKLAAVRESAEGRAPENQESCGATPVRKYLRIVVNGDGKDVNMRVPLSFVRTG